MVQVSPGALKLVLEYIAGSIEFLGDLTRSARSSMRSSCGWTHEGCVTRYHLGSRSNGNGNFICDLPEDNRILRQRANGD
jgi:hypothetical protein